MRMDANAVDAAIKFLLTEMHRRLDEAAGTAKAAVVCAESGNTGKAVEIVLDIEQLTYESANLLNAASTLNRIARDSVAG
jgi:hypothetical protein